MSDFKQKIMAAAALEPGIPYPGLDEMNHREGEKYENNRLTPLLTRLVDEVEVLKAALEKNKSEWETVSPDGYKHLVAWQMARDALTAHQKRWEDLK